MVRNTDVQEHNIIVQYTIDFDIYTFVERARGFGVPRVIQLIIFYLLLLFLLYKAEMTSVCPSV